MSESNGFTPTQKRMLAVLSDHKPHSRKELHACLNDELQPLKAIQSHLSNMRKILRFRGQDIAFVILNCSAGYLLVDGLYDDKSA